MKEQTPGRRRVPTEVLVEMARLKGLSDGVVAFALTLLVLDIRVAADVLTDGLPAAIGELGPGFAVYLISFVLIGGAWGSHQRMLGQIERGDGLMVWWTLLSLLPVTLVPASAALLGDHPGAPVALVVFAIDVVAIEVTGALLWRHASRQQLIDPNLDPRVVRSIGRRLWFVAVCFAISIPIALISVPLAYVVWLATFALVFTTDWLSWQQSRLATTESIKLEDTSRATVRFEHGSGNLRVEPTSDLTDLVEGPFGGGGSSRVTRTDGSADVRLSLPTRTAILSPRYPWAWGLASLLDWDVALSPAIALELDIVTSAGRATLDLERLRVSRTQIAANACTVGATLRGRRVDRVA